MLGRWEGWARDWIKVERVRVRYIFGFVWMGWDGMGWINGDGQIGAGDEWG